jgi:hypothetical protein
MGRKKVLPTLRKVFVDSLDRECYELASDGDRGYFYENGKTLAQPPVRFSCWRIYGIFRAPGRDGVVGERKIIRNFEDESTATEEYRRLSHESSELKLDVDKIVYIGGLAKWFDRMKQPENSDIMSFSRHSRSRCEAALKALVDVYGASTRIEDVRKDIILHFSERLRKYDRQHFEAICGPIKGILETQKLGRE